MKHFLPSFSVLFLLSLCIYLPYLSLFLTLSLSLICVLLLCLNILVPLVSVSSSIFFSIPLFCVSALCHLSVSHVFIPIMFWFFVSLSVLRCSTVRLESVLCTKHGGGGGVGKLTSHHPHSFIQSWTFNFS